MKKLSIRQQVNRIESILEMATDTEMIEGVVWYEDANEFGNEIANEYGLSLGQVSRLISLLSPQNRWEQNKIDVVRFLDGNTNGIFSTKRTLAECSAVVDEGFIIPESRMKTFAFAKCIEEAKVNESDPVVIDRHAIKIAYGQMDAKPIIITDCRYREAVEAYQKVAEKYGMKAHQVQAVTWVAYKRIVNR